MRGWNLNAGFILKEVKNDNEIWLYLSKLFSSKTRNTTSYKFVFLRCILENIYNLDTNLCITIDSLFMKFTEIYWNLVVLNKLSQCSTKSSVEIELIHYIDTSLVNIGTIEFNSLPNTIKDQLYERVTKVGKKYVIGALYGDFDGSIYEFSKISNLIKLSPKFYEFFRNYNKIIYSLNNYELIKYIGKFNHKDYNYNIVIKIENITKRTNLSVFRSKLLNNDDSCFYCGKKLDPKEGSIEIDHFIPWSFIHDDQIWNLVQTCRTCNNSKREDIPKNFFLDKLILRNERFLTITELKTLLNFYSQEKIHILYENSILNGYNANWMPKAQDFK